MSVMKEWKVGINLIFKQPLTASIVAIVGSFLKLVCSIVLFHGIRKNKHILFLPWLAEETIELVFGTVLFFMETIQKQWLVNSSLFLVLIIYHILLYQGRDRSYIFPHCQHYRRLLSLLHRLLLQYSQEEEYKLFNCRSISFSRYNIYWFN